MKVRFIIFLISILIYSPLVKAQFGPQEIVTGPLAGAKDVKCFDLDGDGDMDILAAFLANTNSKLAWYENDGIGVFGESQIISDEVYHANSIYASDLDGDGDLDVLSASRIDDKIAWYENDGFGNFGDQQIITIEADLAMCVYAADLDGDGDMDVLSASRGDDKIAWYENDGFGNFEDEEIITEDADYAVSVFASDLDGDGDMDVLSASRSDDKIAWYENDGLGNFGVEQIITLDALGAVCVYASDLDGDGDKDVLSASEADNKIAWYENDGLGDFSAPSIISTLAINATSVYASDLDGDGDMDVLSSSEDDSKIAWYENDGLGSFGPEEIITTETGKAYSVYASDIDADGDMDVLSATNIAWFSNDGLGSFSEPKIVLNETAGARTVLASDLDGDGYLDLISGSWNDNKLAWYKNNGLANFSDQQIITDNDGPCEDVQTSDLDGDGDIDIITANGGIDWYENDGFGVFSEAHSIFESCGSRSVYTSDIDHDGDIDVLTTCISSGHISWFENDGFGGFGEEQVISTETHYPTGVSAADLNGDGYDDVLSASWNDDKIAWYQNDGLGDFGEQQIISISADGATSVHVSDLDGDGDMDVLSSSYNDNKIAWYENDGLGSFGSEQIISSDELYTRKVYSADLDGDGDKDVLTVSTGDQKINWYENDGLGNFGVAQIISTEVIGPVDIRTADIDGDGDMDIMSASGSDHKIAIYRNLYIHNEQIEGRLYYDENENGEYDDGEVGLSIIPIQSSPESDYTFTHEDGTYNMLFTPGPGTYEIAPEEIPYWELITYPLSYTVIVDAEYSILDSLDFGFFPETIITEINPTLTGGFPRCNEIINYWLDFRNSGTTLPSGVAHLELDEDIEYVSADILPDSIVGQNIYWHYDSLLYFSAEQIQVSVDMPSFLSLGDTLRSFFSISAIDDMDEIIYTNEDTLSQILVCAYDPNDKIAEPAGIDSLGYISPTTQELDYTIRFQNTGTDTAITVVVKDQLDPNLDLYSFEPIASSHEMFINIEETGEVTFTFENIMLPDSNVNELASHGFVRFKIDLLEGLPLGTSIYNTGYIYFDENPAVNTNTKINTLACLDTALISPIGDNDTLCIGSSLVFLEGLGLPTGGLFSGTGVAGDTFDADIAGIGLHSIYYTFENEGCTTIDSTIVSIFDLPEVNFEDLENEIVCLQNGVIMLVASPIDGHYSGAGVIGSEFDPLAAGEGTHNLYYSYEDDNSCSATDSVQVTVIDCLGIDELGANQFTLYPNPFGDFTTLNFGQELTELHSVIVNDMLGKEVYRNDNVIGSSLKIESKNLVSGSYTLSLFNSSFEEIFTTRLLVE